MRITKVGVMSFAKMFGSIGFVIGLLISITYIILGSIYSVSNGAQAGVLPLTNYMVIVLPFIYGALMFVSGIIAASFYNLFAKLLGGVELTLEEYMSKTI